MTLAARRLLHLLRKHRRAGGGGTPPPLPLEVNFESASTGSIPNPWIQRGVQGIWSGTQGTAEVQNRVDGFSFDVPHTKAMYLEGNNTTNVGSSVSLDLGGPLDMSDGIRVAWYARHYNEAAGGDDAAIFFAPVFGSTGGDPQDFVRCHQQATSENWAKLQWYKDAAYVFNDQCNGTYTLQGTHQWHMYRWELNFAAGTGLLQSWKDTGSWTNDYGVTFTFTATTGPQNLRYLSLGSPGSSSTWKVYHHQQIAQVWVGALTDAWPTVGNIWSV
jgi:hypothetical protein